MGLSRYAPASSSDGQIIIYGKNLTFAEGEFFVLQTATALPRTVPWATVVGNAYWLSQSGGAANLGKASISFNYLSNEVPPGEEDFLRIYFLADGSTEWRTLKTNLNADHNLASAPVQPGDGLYALMSSIDVALTPFPGSHWAAFGFPVNVTRAVTTALLSISGHYTSVYGYDPTDAEDPWKMYDVNIPAHLQEQVNDLKNFVFGRSYWISLDRDVILQLKGKQAQERSTDNGSPFAPPATYYGQVMPASGFVPQAGMIVTASINGRVCGRGRTFAVDDQTYYSINVSADGLSSPGCGVADRAVALQVENTRFSAVTGWNNDRPWEVVLRVEADHALYLPLLQR